MDKFQELISAWGSPSDQQGPLFSPGPLAAAVLTQIDSAADQARLQLLREIVAQLYLCGRQFVQVLEVLSGMVLTCCISISISVSLYDANLLCDAGATYAATTG